MDSVWPSEAAQHHRQSSQIGRHVIAALCIKRSNNLADFAGVLNHDAGMEHTKFGLIKKRGEIAGQHKVAQKAADALKADLGAIDRALVLCG